MKRILSIILFMISFGLNAQTTLDSALFDKINEYRVSNGVSEIAWDTNIFKAANHHSTYLKLLNYDSLRTFITHSEAIRLDDFEELMYFTDRFKKYVPSKCILISENITGTLKHRNFPEEKLVDIIFNNWKKSKKHNGIMLSPKLKKGACSIVVFVNYFHFSPESQVKPIELQKSFATINFSD